MTFTRLLDGNVLVALADQSHVHHAAASSWFAARDVPFATCPITQGTLLRLMLRFGAVPDMGDAIAFLAQLTGHPRHRFWPADFQYLEVDARGIHGHRQVTDAYLATLARRQGGRMATFDRGLAALYPDVVDLVAEV